MNKFTPDFDQLKLMNKDQVVARIREIGGDVHPSENKTDLIGRLLQLQGTAQPIDKIRKELEAHGIGEDGATSGPPIPKQTNRLTIEQMKTAMKPYMDKGMKFRVSKDGTNWEMSMVCKQLEQGGRILDALRRDSGNTMIPLSVLVRIATTMTTVNEYRKKNLNAGDGYVDVAEPDEDEVAA